MPELPEVETIVRRLSQVLVGKVIREIVVLKDKSFQGETPQIVGETITGVSRKAKCIRFHLSPNKNLLAHLKMTGQFIFVSDNGSRLGGGHPTADWISELPSKHTRVFFTLVDSSGAVQRLYFNDMRIFGWIRFADDSQVQTEFEKYAPDIHLPEVNEAYFWEKIKKTARPIKQVIMDNAVVSGVGNIYACDGLHLAKIHPQRPAHMLSRTEAKDLLSALKTVIELGISLGGATIDSYLTVDGFSGKYQEQVRVYGQAGKQCKACDTPITKIKLAGRGTYFCPLCQK